MIKHNNVMNEKLKIGEKYFSKVNFRKLIKDLREQFPYDSLTALIVETIANSIDANATKISINVSDDSYCILDNGTGMTKSQFIEYHNIASLTKEKGKGGIGFAGIGAKVYLDRAYYIITETKSKSFHGATKWMLTKNGELIYEPVLIRTKIPYKTGTFIEVKIKNNEDKMKLNSKFVQEIVRKYYNSVLLGYYGQKEIKVNGSIINGWKINAKHIEKRKDIRISFRWKSHTYKIKGFIIKSKKDIPEEFQGIFIVVHGKTIMSYWFKQIPLEYTKFTGLILADDLISILTTSKSDFNRESGLWKVFHRRVSREIGAWLEQIQAKPKVPVRAVLKDIAKDLERSLNRILKKPEFEKLADAIFQSMLERTVSIRSVHGTEMGMTIQGVQKTKGTLGGLGVGKGVSTVGEWEGKGVKFHEEGAERVERVRRRVRGGIRIGYEYQPGNALEGWLTESAIIINVGAPTWKIACGMSLNTQYDDVIIYHILRVVSRILVDEAKIEPPDDEKLYMQLLNTWYEENIPPRIKANVETFISLGSEQDES